MKKSIFFFGCLALVLLLATVALAGRYDLQSFDTSIVAAQTTEFAANFAVGTANPTVGTQGSLVLEFTAAAAFAAGSNSFLAYLPGYDCDEKSISRFSTLDAEGNVLQQTPWQLRDTWSGDVIDRSIDIAGAANSAKELSSFELVKTQVFGISSAIAPLNPLRVFWPAPFAIAVGVRVRIELRNIRLPPTFDTFSQECLAAFNAADAAELFIQNENCCKQFEIKIGAALGVAVGPVATKQIVVASVSATFCPNFGNIAAAPAACSATPPSEWTERLRFTCCQYDAWTDNAACDIVWCRSHTVPSVSNPTRCCNVVWTTVTSPMCPQCSFGNWFDTCCEYIVQTDGLPVVDEDLLENYRTNPYCLAKRCQCEDFDEQCCALTPDFSPYWSTEICPICTNENFHESCCLQHTWKNSDRCLCYGPDFYYDPDYCCQTPENSMISMCPIDNNCTDEGNSCGCDCEEEPSCPCFLLNQLPPTGEPDSVSSVPEINYVKYEKHEMDVSNIQSGHNTVVINHLHIDTHINLEDANDLKKLQELLPSMIFNINSGCSSTDPITAIGNVVSDIITGVKTQVKSDLDSIKSVVNTVKSDVKDAVKDVITSGPVALLAKPVRVIIKIVRSGPLSAIELVALRLLIITQCALSGKPQSGFNVKFISQFGFAGTAGNAVGTAATGSDSGYGVTFDIAESSTTQGDMKTLFDNQSSGLQSAITKQFGSASVSSSNAVAASNECTPGTCTSSCMCELYNPCDSDDQCLSGKCAFSSSVGKKVCADNEDNTSGSQQFFNEYVIGALVLVCSSVLVIFQNYVN